MATAKEKRVLTLLPSKSIDNSEIAISLAFREEYDLSIGGNLTLEVENDELIKANPIVVSTRKPLLEDIKKTKNSGIFSACYGRLGFVSPQVFQMLPSQPEIVPEIDDLKFTTITLGADPEFGIRSPGQSKCTYARTAIDDTTLNNRFGQDGPCCEIRPRSAVNAEDLVKNIQSSFKLGLKGKSKSYEWVGGIAIEGVNSNGDDRLFQIGGHVHIGYPVLQGTKRDILAADIVRILDEYLAIPMAFIEEELGSKRREYHYENYKYGFWGDYRDKPKDKPTRLEWRTVSGFWILYPALTKAFLEITHGISKGIYRMLMETCQDNDFSNVDAITMFKEKTLSKLLNLKLKNKEEYTTFLIKLGRDNALREEYRTKISNSLKEIPKIFPEVSKEAVNILLEYVKIHREVKKEIDLKNMWISKEKEPVTGTNLLHSIDNKKPKLPLFKTIYI